MQSEDTKSTSVPVSKPASASMADAELAGIVDRWFAENFQQPPISHRTDCYNQALAARDKLKALLPKRAT